MSRFKNVWYIGYIMLDLNTFIEIKLELGMYIEIASVKILKEFFYAFAILRVFVCGHLE